jgi:hypothetical protein
MNLEPGWGYRKPLCVLVLLIFTTVLTWSGDYIISGKVFDDFGGIVTNAKVSISLTNREYSVLTASDGSYSLRMSGIYGNIHGLLEQGIPYPNPFSHSVNIPFIINSQGDIRFNVFNMAGQKIKEIIFESVYAGSYRIIWDGSNQYGTPQRPGFYFFAITFKGKTWSGRLVKAAGFSTYSAGSGLEQDMMPPVTSIPGEQSRIQVITNVTCKGYYPVRLTDITIAADTVIDFHLSEIMKFPFRTERDNIEMFTTTGYRPLILKGINLGSSPPGYFPGEIAYAITGEMYENWIRLMAETGFNSIRVYTLHPPVFYEKLAEYNQRNPSDPLLLFQGIWLDEVEDASISGQYDLINRIPQFKTGIREVINCIHGNCEIAFRPGRAYGNYITDVSRWTVAFIIGREISSQEVDSTDVFHSNITSYTGDQFSINGATATEVFVTRMLDETAVYESQTYSSSRPVSISSWPTLDPLVHPTEIYTDEDIASFNIMKISRKSNNAGLFASYHAYPYYPNFISQEPSYLVYNDNHGRNSYLGYLNALKSHYADIPLVIAEFGVPSSWGSAHQSFSDMHHGGYSEKQQGEKNLRLMNNVIDAGCAGGFMFSWMDEWFKPTWIVGYLEAVGTRSGGTLIPTRQLWHNLTSPEQNFGLLAYEQTSHPPFEKMQIDKPGSPVTYIGIKSENNYLMIEIEAGNTLSAGDTILIAFDTYGKDKGESLLPNGKSLNNRSEFLMSLVMAEDSAIYHVTSAYDMNGLTPRFDLTDHSVQKFRSINTDGASWKIMQWINDGFELTSQDIGKLPVENSTEFTPGQRTALAWSGNRAKVRIPWTMLYFHDPTQMKVIDGAESYDGRYSYEINTVRSDGIALSVYMNGVVTETVNRYTWPFWLVVPPTEIREKESLRIIKSGLSFIPEFAD